MCPAVSSSTIELEERTSHTVPIAMLPSSRHIFWPHNAPHGGSDIETDAVTGLITKILWCLSAFPCAHPIDLTPRSRTERTSGA